MSREMLKTVLTRVESDRLPMGPLSHTLQARCLLKSNGKQGGAAFCDTIASYQWGLIESECFPSDGRAHVFTVDHS